MKEIDCEQAAERLHTFLDRELDEAEVAEVQAHLDNCVECYTRFRFEGSLKRLIKAGSSKQTAPPSLRDKLAGRLGQRRPGPLVSRRYTVFQLANQTNPYLGARL